MAIYHCTAKIITRSTGRSAVAAAAYRAGEKITNEHDGRTHDYSRRHEIAYTEIMLPAHAPEAYRDRSTLWNAVEKSEKRKDSQLAREIEIALPNELSRKEQIKLVQRYVKENFVDKGMCADIAIHTGQHRQKPSDTPKTDHDKELKPDNPHAHIMLTLRPIDQDGKWAAKSKDEYVLNKNGDRIKLKSGRWKSRKVDTTNWNQRETLLMWRENWAKAVNLELEKKN